MRYLDRDEHREHLNRLKYYYRLYEGRYETMKKRMIQSGQSRAIPVKIEFEDIVDGVKNKIQLQKTIDSLHSYRVGNLGGKDKEGKYRDVIVGKYGASITRSEYEDLQRIVNKVNDLKRRAKRNIEKMGYEDKSFDYEPIKLNLDVSQDYLDMIKKSIREREYITNYFTHTINIKRENMIEAFRKTYNPDAPMLTELLNEINNDDLNILLRDKASFLNFDYVYDTLHSELYNQRLSKILYQFKYVVGEERYNDIVSQYNDKWVDVKPRVANIDEFNNIEKRVKMIKWFRE